MEEKILKLEEELDSYRNGRKSHIRSKTGINSKSIDEEKQINELELKYKKEKE